MSDRSRRSFLRNLAALPVGATVGAGVLTLRDRRTGGGDGPSPDGTDDLTVTTSTTRLAGSDAYETATAITQNVYPAINEHTSPGAAILLPDHDLAAALPGVSFIHHPIDGAVLLTGRDELPEVTRGEIERLDPEGVAVDRNVQMYIIGGERYVGRDVESTVEELDMKVQRISGETPVEVAANADQYLSTIHADHRDTVFIADRQDPDVAIPAQSWNAHGGDGFLYVDGDRIPGPTRQQLDARFYESYMYLLGNEDAIGPAVASELAQFGHVQRVPRGSDPFALSAGFAGYRDVGRNQGFVVGEWPREIGWGIAEAGHNFIFANPGSWQMALPACVESHRGKHGPMLHVRQDEVPDPVANYLTNLVRPYESAPDDRKFNFGWIVGGTDQVSERVQARLQAMLETAGGGR